MLLQKERNLWLKVKMDLEGCDSKAHRTIRVFQPGLECPSVFPTDKHTRSAHI